MRKVALAIQAVVGDLRPDFQTSWAKPYAIAGNFAQIALARLARVIINLGAQNFVALVGIGCR